MARETSARKANKSSVWETPRLREMLTQPMGSPIELTRDEAVAIVRDAAGTRPDLPAGDEYVRKVSWIWAGLLKRRDG